MNQEIDLINLRDQSEIYSLITEKFEKVVYI